ncbi:MAG: hypothetical protein HY368_02470, partial [Candidatus Aenigmarchaeota archaeon]|nr:hypothetical protein [Candidatus Aenigmarchaeota archaeon]
MLLERAYEKFRKQPSYQRIAGTMAVSIGLLGSGGPAFAQNYNPFNYEQLNCRSVREMYIDALQKKRPSWAYSLPPQRREKIALDMEDAFLGRKKSSVIMDRIGKVLDMFDPKRKENPMKRECGWYMMKLLIYFGKAGRATEILLQDINSPRRE